MSELIKIVIVGEGSKKDNYKDSLTSNLEKSGIRVLIKNYARTGTMIDYALGKSDELKKFAPDCLFICYGNVEVIIRPNLKSNTLMTAVLPKRYKKSFMLDSRLFF